MSPSPAGQNSTLRLLLVLIVLAGSACAGYLAVIGELRVLSAGVICLLAVPAVRSLPRGTRPAAWLLAVWTGVSLAFIARAPSVEAWAGGDRTRLAILGAACYLVLAGLGFWACPGARSKSGDPE